MSSHLTQSRTEIMTAVQAFVDAQSNPKPLVESNNKTIVNQDTQEVPYLKVSIMPMNGDGQASLGQNALNRQDGQILVSACAKGGTGEMAANALLEALLPYLDKQDFGLVKTHAVRVVEPKDVKGWWYANAIIPYYYHYFYS
jgi:hypothetical protein